MTPKELHANYISWLYLFLAQNLKAFRNKFNLRWSIVFNSLLLITIANSLYPDQDRQKCRAWSESKLFDILMVFLKEFSEKMIVKKKISRQKRMKN